MTLQEDMVIDHAAKLRTEMLAALDEATGTTAILDLTHVNALDAVGLKLLLGLFRSCQDKNLTLRLEVGSKSVRDVVDFCKLQKYIEVFEVSPNE